jgi:cytochrome b6-f complex iron-sulfur subunit
MMKRREFTRWMTVGAIASSLPVAIAACGNQSAQSDAAPSKAAMPTTNVASGGAVGSIAELDKAGFLTVTVDGKRTTIVRNPDKQDEIVAVNTTCTHNGCAVDWKADKKSHVCSCHGANFDASGKATKGPAKDPLKRYTVKVDGDKIIVQA